MEKHQHDMQITPPQDSASGKAEAIAGVSTLVAMAIAFWTNIETKTYKNLSSLGFFEDMKPKRKEDAAKILQQVNHHKISAPEALEAFDHLIDHNAEEVNKRVARIGVNSIADRWKLLRRHQKIEAGLIAAATGGIAFGSLLPVLKNAMAKPVSAVQSDTMIHEHSDSIKPLPELNQIDMVHANQAPEMEVAPA